MNKKEVRKLFKKFLKKNYSSDEEELLELFLNSYQSKGQNWSEWKHGDKIKFQKRNLKNIKREISSETSVFKLLKFSKSAGFKYAAAFVGVLLATSVFFLKDSFFQDNIQEITEITIELHDGSTTKLTKGGPSQVKLKNGKVLGELQEVGVTYNSKNNSSSTTELVYNTVRIPYGKKWNVVLSDGTKIYLNSGSTLKFPVQFIEGKERKVFLEGEGNFHVTKDSTNAFVVVSKGLNTKVYGTVFNVSAYKDDEDTKVVLVEGSVGVYKEGLTYDKDSNLMLIPNQMAALKNNKDVIAITDVNVESYISWVEGVLFFKNEKFKDIAKKLERHYNIRIKNNFKELNMERFNGRIDAEKDISYVLNLFSKNKTFSYKINNNQLIINP